MGRLPDEEIQRIVRVLKEGKRLPSEYHLLLIETGKESELVYAEKEREENIVAETMAIRIYSYQPVIP